MGTIRLGSLQVDPARNVIANGAASWSIEPKVTDLLVLLAERPGEVLSRDFLIERVWKVEYGADESLTRAVSLLRKTFREAGQADEFIETIPKRGYRLTVAPAPETASPIVSQVPAGRSTRPPAEPAIPPAPAPVPQAPIVAEEQRGAERDRAGDASAKPSAARETSEPRGDAAPANPLWHRRAGVLGGAALAALAVIAFVASTMMRPATAPTEQPASQRIAFFGFTPASADPLAADIAAAATNETFQALLALRLEAASRTETQGVELAQQRARAAELGAAYALGGDVRSAGSSISIHMHLEDVASRTTLWERTVNGSAAEKVSLSVLAAGAATEVTRCLAGARPTLPRQDGDLLAELATACATPYIAYLDGLPRWRALARQAPDSAVIQASLSNSLIYYANHANLSADELREAWKEATTAAQQALAIEPNNGIARTVLAYNAMFEGRPLAEAGALMDAAIRDSPDDWRRGEIGANRTEFLKGVGRNSENLAAAQAAMNRDPLSPTPYVQLAEALVFVGRGPEAGRVFAQLNASWPDAWWAMWPTFAVRYGISDIDEVLAVAPPSVSEESKTCWRQLAKAYASSSPAVRRDGAEIAAQCGADGRIEASTADLLRLRLLGDVGEALAWYGARLDRSLPSTGFLYAGGALLDKNDRALRANPQFLPLMRKSGHYQYWLDTGTRPDLCDDPVETNSEICASLRADQTRDR